MGALICKICNESHDQQSGFFTRHLKNKHDISLRDYVILTEYNNVPPKCGCGLCDEIPNFRRGEFKKYFKNHKEYDVKKELYLEKYGQPKCPTCDNPIEKWNRGEPNKYCNIKCKPSTWNQEKVNKTVKEKYGVDNVFQLNEVKDKIEKTSLEKYGYKKPSQSEKVKEKVKETNLKLYGVENIFQSDEIKQKIKKTMLDKYGYEKASKFPANRKKSSKRMKIYNPMFDPVVAKKSNDTFMENIASGKTKLYNTKKYKDTNLYYQSSYELEFLELCDSIGILDKIKNGNSYGYLDKEYGNRMLTDFSMGDYEIEIKSSYIMEKQGGIRKIFKMRDIIESNNKKYIFILDKDYSEFLDIIK